jgi:hypothetical protein
MGCEYTKQTHEADRFFCTQSGAIPLSKWAGQESNLRPMDYELTQGVPAVCGCRLLSGIVVLDGCTGGCLRVFGGPVVAP